MAYFIIIRGPAAVGKSTIAKELTRMLDGYYISFDDIMKENRLDDIGSDGISEQNFIRANMLVIPHAKEKLKNQKNVIFDGCFYRKKQMDHLLRNIPFKCYIFSLNAPLKVCSSRNERGKRGMAKEAIADVYHLVSDFKIGIMIETSGRSVKEITREIISYLPVQH